jgi:hypothetical protein
MAGGAETTTGTFQTMVGGAETTTGGGQMASPSLSSDDPALLGPDPSEATRHRRHRQRCFRRCGPVPGPTVGTNGGGGDRTPQLASHRPRGGGDRTPQLAPHRPRGGGRPPGHAPRSCRAWGAPGPGPAGWWPVSPPSRSRACGSRPRIAARLSVAPFGLPGRSTISVRPRTPQTPRDRSASGVIARPAARIASASPGACRSTTSSVASGVTSRGPNPVPPVIATSATRSSSASVRRWVAMASRSSGVTTRRATSKPAPVSRSATATPEAS